AQLGVRDPIAVDPQVENIIGVFDDRLVDRVDAVIAARGQRPRLLRGAARNGEAEGAHRSDPDQARHGRGVLSISGGHQKLNPGWAAAVAVGCAAGAWLPAAWGFWLG